MEPIEYLLYYRSLERGAEVNMQGGNDANALQAAAIQLDEVGGAFEEPEKSSSATVPSSLVTMGRRTLRLIRKMAGVDLDTVDYMCWYMTLHFVTRTTVRE